MNRTCRLTLSDPVLVAQAPPEMRQWGPYQFCALERLNDGAIHLRYHVEADSATAYGKNAGHAVTADGGRTWRTIDNPSGQSDLYLPGQGVQLPNGDRLIAHPPQSRSVKGVQLPTSVGDLKATYCYYVFYRFEDMTDLRLPWRFYRLPSGGTRWIEENADVQFEGQLLYTVEDVIPAPQVWRMRRMADDSLWLMQYPWRMVDGKVDTKMRVQFLRSTDGGHTWYSHGEIPYQPIHAADAVADKRDGFSEPDATILPDGSVLAVFRTQDGNPLNGPSYYSRSTDGGRTWSRPQIFDDLGVWPDLLTMRCGVTLAAYGRPGLYLRATTDPAGLQWQDRVTVVPPLVMGTDTCSYSALLPLSDHEALLAYSNFNIPGPDGRPCKSILARRVTVG